MNLEQELPNLQQDYSAARENLAGNILWVEILEFTNMSIFDGSFNQIITAFKISNEECQKVIYGLCLLGHLRLENGKIKTTEHKNTSITVGSDKFKSLATKSLAGIESEQSKYNFLVVRSNISAIKTFLAAIKEAEEQLVSDSKDSAEDDLYELVWHIQKKDILKNLGGYNA